MTNAVLRIFSSCSRFGPLQLRFVGTNRKVWPMLALRLAKVCLLSFLYCSRKPHFPHLQRKWSLSGYWMGEVFLLWEHWCTWNILWPTPHLPPFCQPSSRPCWSLQKQASMFVSIWFLSHYITVVNVLKWRHTQSVNHHSYPVTPKLQI